MRFSEWRAKLAWAMPSAEFFEAVASNPRPSVSICAKKEDRTANGGLNKGTDGRRWTRNHIKKSDRTE